MKKLIAGLLIFFCVAIASFWLVDVNRYLPSFVNGVNQKIQGKLELGRGSLSLWKGARVEVEGLKLSDAQGSPILVVQKAFFKVPWISLVMRALHLKKEGFASLVLQVEGAEIYLKKEAGVWNFFSLLPPASPKQASSSAGVPGLSISWGLNVDFLNTLIHYEDGSMKTQVHGIELHLEDLSLTQPSRVYLVAHVEKRDAIFQISGKTQFKAQIFPEIHEQRVRWQVQADFRELEAMLPGKFEKKKGIPASFRASGLLHGGSQLRVAWEDVQVSFLQSQWKGDGSMVWGEDLSFVAHMKSDPMEIAGWTKVLPFLEAYQPTGHLRFEATVQRQKTLDFQGKLWIDALSAVVPGLKEPLLGDGVVDFRNEQVQASMNFQTSGNEVKVAGKLVSFTHPFLEVKLSASEWNADLLKPHAPSVTKESVAPVASQVQVEDAWTKNPLLLQSRTRFVMDVGGLQAQGIKISDIHTVLETKGLHWSLPRCSFRMFSGAVELGGSGHWDLKPYQLKMQVASLQMKEALRLGSPSLQNTVTGRLDASVDLRGEGSSLDACKGQGWIKMKDPIFSGLDFGKIAVESVEKSMKSLTQKVPGIPAKILHASQKQFRYTLFSADFKIAQGFVEIPSLVGQAYPKEGIDFRGHAKMGLAHGSLEGAWELTDTYGLTHLADIGWVQNGVRVDRILAEKNAPVRLPMKVGCKLAAPCFFYEQTSDHLIRVALSNVAQALQGEAGKKWKEQVAPILKNAPPALQNQLKKWFR